ncbi:MAG: hypothetical protein CMM47_01725 [Rhodospirillaceae bacterium]|nr:hypothetical protein [Rhodospirillaceae bacterium]
MNTESPSDRQDDLIAEMVEAGRTRNEAIFGDRPFVARLSREGIPGVLDGLESYCIGLKKIRNLSIWQRYLLCLGKRGRERVAFIATKVALECAISEDMTMCSCGLRIGRAVEDQALADAFILEDKNVGSSTIKFARRYGVFQTYLMGHITRRVKEERGSKWDEWGQRARLSCGVTLLGYVQKATGAIESFSRRKPGASLRNKPTKFIRLSENTQEWREGYNKHRESLLPLYLPMVIEPTEWTGVYAGGYPRSTELPLVPFVRTHKRRWLKQASFSPEVFKAISRIQSTPFQVNRKVFDVFKWARDSGVGIGGLALGEQIPLPDWPEGELTEEYKRELCVERRTIHIHNHSLRGRHMRISRLFTVASKFVDEERIYFPHSCDFRGRIYPIPSPFFGPQGSDISRGLLKFARAKEIGDDPKWLLIHTANTWGNGVDKQSFEQRIRWVEENTVELRKVASDPVTHRMWLDADEPWQFLASCIELGEMHTTGRKFKTSIPCGMDATNSGIQILSLLARDPVCAEACNVLPSDTPKDIYGDVANLVIERLRVDASNARSFSYHWLHYGIDRGTTKKSVMCYSYGLTKFTNRQFVLDWFDDEEKESPFTVKQKPKATAYLADLIWDAMNSVVVAPAKVMNWMQDLARSQDTGVEWRTPLGFPVLHEKTRHRSQQIKTHFMGNLSYVRFNDDTDEMCPRSMGLSVVPNFVHSLDACALMMTVLRCKIEDFMMVHDCFSTHAPSCDALGIAVREAYCELFSANLLDLFNDSLNIPCVEGQPLMGDLDITRLMDSKYFVS